MDNNEFEFDFDIDSILSDFYAGANTGAEESREEAEVQYAPAVEEPAGETAEEETEAAAGQEEYADADDTAVFAPAESRRREQSRREENFSESEERRTRRSRPSSRKHRDNDELPARPEKKRQRKAAPEKEEKISAAQIMPAWLVKTAGILASAAMLTFIACNTVPAAGSAAAAKTTVKTLDISASINSTATELARNASVSLISENSGDPSAPEQLIPAEPAATKTVYVIPNDALVAPDYIPSGMGRVSTNDASEILNIIEQARSSGLLREDERVVFTPDVEFNTGSYYQDIQYYIDDTLLVICWKEIIEGNTCTFCEIKVQDASQFRRKLAGDMFGSDILEYTTSMHASTNAVVSMNADYYRFRDMGLVVYDGELYRFNESDYLRRYDQMLKKYNCIDSMFVTEDGDFLFYHLYEETTSEELQQFIADRKIRFSIAFGPILVENGELNTSYFDEEWYPIGEINTGYSRAGIGQVDSLHYLYMSLNHSDEKAARWHTKEFAQHFYDKGVINAYSLDGGQTSEIVFQGGEAYNHVDHVNGTNSRQVSDMIYFASAINGEKVTR